MKPLLMIISFGAGIIAGRFLLRKKLEEDYRESVESFKRAFEQTDMPRQKTWVEGLHDEIDAADAEIEALALSYKETQTPENTFTHYNVTSSGDVVKNVRDAKDEDVSESIFVELTYDEYMDTSADQETGVLTVYTVEDENTSGYEVTLNHDDVITNWGELVGANLFDLIEARRQGIDPMEDVTFYIRNTLTKIDYLILFEG